MKKKSICDINSLDELISYYESIPEDNWCKNKYEDGNGNYCALGHLGITDEIDLNFVDAQFLFKELNENLSTKSIIYSNDGKIYFGRGNNPKQRVLELLKDIKEGYNPKEAVDAYLNHFKEIINKHK